MPPNYSKEIEVAKKLALKAGEIMLKYFDIDQEVKIKSDNSPVTIADTLINQMVIDELSKDFPEDGIIGEEQSTSEYGMGRKWFCDPIDGTSGYVAGLPTAMFSLGLVIDGEPVAGVTYNPFLKKIYEASKGNGSFCNGKKLQVSNLPLEGNYLAMTGSFSNEADLRYITEAKRRGARFAGVTGFVFKSCLIAQGRLVGHINHGAGAHDLAAVQVIVEEAGGKVTGIKGQKLDYYKPFKGLVVSNGKVHDELVEIINGSYN